MALLDQIKEDQISAMKAKDEQKRSTLRMLLSAIKNEEIETGSALSDEQVQAVVQRQVKQLRDALKEFEASNRDDLVEQHQAEIDIMSSYMPEQLSEDDVRSIVQDTIAEMSNGESPQFGQIMGVVMQKVKGQADGNMVRSLVSEVLEKSK